MGVESQIHFLPAVPGWHLPCCCSAASDLAGAARAPYVFFISAPSLLLAYAGSRFAGIEVPLERAA